MVAEGQRGFEVAPVSAENLREIAALRLLLESHALTQSFAAGDMDWEGRVVSAYHKLSAIEKKLLAGDRADPETWKRYDWEFHHALISACGSNALLETHAPVYDKYLRYQMIAGIFRGEIAAHEHHKLLDCALSRDAEDRARRAGGPHRGVRRFHAGEREVARRASISRVSRSPPPPRISGRTRPPFSSPRR